MNYPPYPLSNRTRRIVFAVFTVLFLIIAPTVALYTAGYRLSFESLRFTRIGVLSVDIEPQDASVYLNNTRIVQNIPMRVSNLVPGTYNFRIEKNGYLPLVKDIVIEKNKTTYIKDITLFSIHTPEAVETQDTLTDIFPSHDGNYIIEKFDTNGQTKFVLFDTERKFSTPLITKNIQKEAQIVWSEKSNTLALIETDASSTKVKVLAADNPSVSSTLQVSDELQSYQWKESFYKDTFLLKFKNSLYTIDPQNISPRENIHSTSSLFFRDDNNQDWYFEPSTQSLKNKKESLYVGTDILHKIIDINKNRAIVHTGSGLVVVERNDTDVIKNIGTANFFYNTDRKEYIAWSPWELWTMYDNGTVALLNRMSEAIIQVAALDKTGELLVVTNNKLLGFNPGYYVTHEILTDVHVEKITVQKKARMMYFFGTWNGKKGLYTLKY